MMNRFVLMCFFFSSWGGANNVVADDPPHLILAKSLVNSVTPERNAYLGGATQIVWPEAETKSEEVVNESVCSSFCAALLRKAYDLDKGDLEKLFTEEWPEADEWFEGVSKRRSFKVIESLKDAEPGDFLVIDYQSAKAIPTGHVMLISAKPEKVESLDTGSIPFPFHEDATQKAFESRSVIEWHVPVIDSSKGPHGKTDTRYHSAKGGEDDDGVGEGPIRILADKEGRLLGYT